MRKKKKEEDVINNTTNNETNNPKKKKRGFTLIELLAVIIILGILMIIAIPSVTKYISDSRKNAYVDTAKEIVAGTRNLVNGGKLGMYDTNTTYYIPSSYIKTENAQKSPYGEFEQAYVGVVYDGSGYKYYWISSDDAGQGVDEIVPIDKLDTDNIKSDINPSDIENIIKSTGIGNRSNIKVLDNNGVWSDYNASNKIPETGGSPDVKPSSNEINYFDFDASTGTITGIHDVVVLSVTNNETCANYLVNTYGGDYSEAFDDCSNNFNYELDQEFADELTNAGIITGYHKYEYPKDLVIPDKINGETVRIIGQNAFYNKKLNTVVLPNTISEIGGHAFFNSGIKNINIPEGVISIGGNAFSNCYLQKVTIPSTVTSIGSYAFFENSFLYLVVNKTNRSFNWNSVFGQAINSSNNVFASGTYNYTESNSKQYQIRISTIDDLTINIDSIFNYGSFNFDLISNNGYKVYYFNNNTNTYELASVGPMTSVDGTCCRRNGYFLIKDNNDNIKLAGLHKYTYENCMC